MDQLQVFLGLQSFIRICTHAFVHRASDGREFPSVLTARQQGPETAVLSHYCEAHICGEDEGEPGPAGYRVCQGGRGEVEPVSMYGCQASPGVAGEESNELGGGG